MEQLHEGIATLGEYDQFILWRIENKEVTNQAGEIETVPTKVPKHPRTGANVDAHDPNVWADFRTAQQQAPLFGCEVGFVFTDQDPFFFIDVDHCKLPSGEWSPTAMNLANDWFPGAAVEVSWSQEGLHIFGRGTAPRERKKKCKEFDWDLYTEKRFVALTNNVVCGDINTHHTPNLEQLAAVYLAKTAGVDVEWSTEPDPDWCGPTDDDELIEMMLNAQVSGASIYGNKATLRDLWEGNVDALSVTYPPDGPAHPFNHSDADQALCGHLSFWTGKDAARMDRLFRRSALMRDKWEERGEDYREPTVCNAIGWGERVLQSKKYAPPTTELPAPVAALATRMSGEVRQRTGAQYLGVEQQKKHFEGCVYVALLHEVYTPDGCFLKPETFKVIYGGYLYIMDGENQDVSKNAWEAFTCSRVLTWPRVHRTCFRPELGQREIIKEDGWLMLNTYLNIETPRAPGDATPFLTHMCKLFPDPSDYAIMLSYMAAVVQHKGVKFQWCPVVQGAEGNGKTVLMEVLSHCVGHRYTFLPNAKELGASGAKFTEWLFEKVFIGIEEIYIGDKRDVADSLKPMVTNRRLERQGKGSDQVMGDNRANFLMLTNHKEGIRKTRNDRRYAVFFTPQQSVEDLQRDGMNEKYFNALFSWLADGGLAIANDFLATYEIPAHLNPAVGCHRAPETSSTREAYDVSLGSAEHEIVEAVQSGRVGFKGGWISSKCLDDLLLEKRFDRLVPRNKRKDVLLSLNYIPHPSLIKGRLSTVSTVDQCKSRLYVLAGNPLLLSYESPRQVLEAYDKAQGLGDINTPNMPVDQNVMIHS